MMYQLIYGVSRKKFWNIAREFYKNPSRGILNSKITGSQKLTQKLQQKYDEKLAKK